jgi:glycosyltransferase involved in cell wall biosynthesis
MKLSIITINRNNAFGLDKTIHSVIDQTFTDYEYIVIDGVSTDNSVEIIKKYSSKISYWVSEPDTGIYNAMNKGIRNAQGEYCLFLNSGDWIISSTTLQDVFNEISNTIPVDIFYSDYIRTDGIHIKFPDNLTIIHLIKGPIGHQNSIIKRSLFLEHGFYNEELNIAADWEFFLYELWKYKSNFFHIKTSISVFDMHGIGSNDTPERSAENITIIQNVFNELAGLIIEYKNYHDSAYHKVIETINRTKILLFFLRLYKFTTSRFKRIKNIFVNFILVRIIRKIYRLFINIFVYFFEIITSVFDRKTRISFTNFSDIPHNFFIIPILKFFESGNNSYKIVNYYNPHIHFFSVFGNKKKILKSKAPCKIFFTGEETNNNYIKYKGNCTDIVSLSFGFDFIEAGNYLHLPLWLLYYFSPDNSKDEIKKILMNFKKHYQKVKFCSLIAGHDRSGIRTKIYNEISKIKAVDCPGSLLHNDDTLHKQYANDKALYLQQYKFNICPENTISQGYVTEKLFQSLYSGCIPIYNGWNKNPEPDIVNPDIILWYDENDTNTLIEKVKYLYLDDKASHSFMDQPFFCDTAVDKIYFILQQFMDKIQFTVNESIKRDI